jgi:enoyl-CoA hydratase/carnithine racemase
VYIGSIPKSAFVNFINMSSSTPSSPIFIEYRDKIAIITLNKPQKLNSFNKDEFYELATLLREADARVEILLTLLIGAGRFFSA